MNKSKDIKLTHLKLYNEVADDGDWLVSTAMMLFSYHLRKIHSKHLHPPFIMLNI